jgi:hypothetical protein
MTLSIEAPSLDASGSGKPSTREPPPGPSNTQKRQLLFIYFYFIVCSLLFAILPSSVKYFSDTIWLVYVHVEPQTTANVY